MKRYLVFGAAVLTAAVSISAANAAKDDFNRDQLGPKWKVVAGSLFIQNDALQGSGGALGYFKPSKAAVSASVTANPTGPFAAVALGDIAHLNNIYVQVGNAAGQWGFGSFAEGNNSNGTTFQMKALLAGPIRITVSMCGTVATLAIKSTLGGKAQKYTFDYGKTFPTGAGLGMSSNTALDDYQSKTAGCKTDPTATVIRRASQSKGN